MATALSKSQIASEIAEKNSITKKQAVEILEYIADDTAAVALLASDGEFFEFA